MSELVDKDAVLGLVKGCLKNGNASQLIDFIKEKGYKTKQINKIVKIILNNIPSQKVYVLSQMLLKDKRDISKDLVCDLIWVCYPDHKDYVLDVLFTLANDKDWGVRESAAWLVYHLLKNYYADFKPFLKKMIDSQSPNIRRTAAVGIMRYAKHKIPKRGRELLKLLEPLLFDRNPYVKRNLGPFVIGDGFLRYYPEETISWLKMWMKEEDEQVRWNIAKAFSTAEAVNHFDAAMEILGYLAKDGRKYVRAAVMSSLKNLLKRKNLKIQKMSLKYEG